MHDKINGYTFVGNTDKPQEVAQRLEGVKYLLHDKAYWANGNPLDTHKAIYILNSDLPLYDKIMMKLRY